ncbi:glycosyltransferase [Knoellia locipacati]|uniref:Glycosyl transferase family 1 n=1 Tax=Knoellia locipacati TaxID=882824 RepID=A0A512T3P3_9MICO|nr:glycosyl transferase family 1 [Knoellia locipacati]
MRVLWLIKGLGPGGAEQLLVSAAEVARDERFAYSVAYVRADKQHLVAKLAASGVPATCLATGVGGARLWPLRLRRRLRDVDIVHAHSPLLAGVVRLLARTLPTGARPKVVTTEHNVWRSFSTPTRWLNRLTSGLDDHRFAVSDEVRRSMTPRASRHSEVLVHGINHESFERTGESRDAVRTALSLRPDTVAALTVANFRTEKDYPNLLRAAATACAADPHLTVLAVGQGPLEHEVRELHAALGLGDQFVLLGFRDDVPDLMRAVDLFVLGSAHEGLPVAVMEALAAGLPVVATDVGGVAEAVVDGQNGFLVPSRDPKALAAAMLRVAGDPGLRAVLSRGARAGSSRFDIRTALTRQQDVYAVLAAS